MNKILVLFVVLLSFFVLFRVARRSRLLNKIIRVQPVEQTPTTANPTINPVVNQVSNPSSSPFGVMISGNTSQVKAQTAVKLGAKYYRPISIFVERWQGSCEECDAAVQAGLKLVLTVRNNGGAGQPTSPPSDLNAFKQTLSQIVDKYRPEVLVIENEENSAALFYNGTTQQYLQELKAGCEVAHQKGIKCTNGGLVS